MKIIYRKIYPKEEMTIWLKWFYETSVKEYNMIAEKALYKNTPLMCTKEDCVYYIVSYSLRVSY